MQRDTIVDRLISNGLRLTYRPALWFERDDGTWRAVSWRAYVRRARWFAGALISVGYQPGDCVAIIGNNSVEWLIADVGAMVARAVPAGIYQTSTVEQLAYIASHCSAKVIVVEDEAAYDKVFAARDRLPDLERIVMIRGAERISDELVIGFEDFCQLGAELGGAVDERIASIEPGDLATLIYTSGTTGPPKGVMLSASNLAETASIAVEIIGRDANLDDSVVSYLPLSHIAEQMFSIHVAITSGYACFICPQLDKLKDTLVAGRPTYFLGVPRVWEKFHAALEQKLGEASGLKAAIVKWSREVGLEVGRARLAGKPVSRIDEIKYQIADRLFFSKLKSQLGLDRLKVAVTGAAPISLEVLEFFLSCGIVIYEVYGQSEGSGPTTFNRPEPGGTKLGSAGLPMPRCEVKLGEDGEIMLRGPNVFMGYFRNEQATAETLRDGWLCSGDIGTFDEDGFLRITDRKKDLLITAGGKNIAPQNIEKLLKSIDGVSQAVVIGDKRKYLAALLTLDPVAAPALAQKQGWPGELDVLAGHDGFRTHVQREVDRVNQGLARYETIKKWVLLPEDFTIESGELTPTQKIKRKVVYEKHHEAIEGMYG
ncbi:MAG: long-chain fatty acid--CoA ligase [Myxococcales bacterium]|nr:long-chain fatty acid--CoA ligase [Myxococcales bacterium]